MWFASPIIFFSSSSSTIDPSILFSSCSSTQDHDDIMIVGSCVSSLTQNWKLGLISLCANG